MPTVGCCGQMAGWLVYFDHKTGFSWPIRWCGFELTLDWKASKTSRTLSLFCFSVQRALHWNDKVKMFRPRQTESHSVQRNALISCVKCQAQTKDELSQITVFSIGQSQSKCTMNFEQQKRWATLFGFLAFFYFIHFTLYKPQKKYIYTYKTVYLIKLTDVLYQPNGKRWFISHLNTFNFALI